MNNEYALESNLSNVKENTKGILKKIGHYAYLFIKRMFDIICSIFGIILLVPIMITVKIVSIINKDHDSIFYSQKRIGKNGKEFKFYKFRSMVPDADEILERTLSDSQELRLEWIQNKKLKEDPRITKVGKLLRKTSIDELPQFINVLKGDMSLIGNRPYLPREKEDIGDYFEDIVQTKPGITGYWQVNGRSETTFKERLKLEKEYSEKASLLLDIKIFFKTFIVVLFGKGAE